MDDKLKKLRSESKTLTPGIIIGKNGITDEVVKNIKSQIKTHGMVKIKLLNTYVENKDKKKVSIELAEKCNAQLIDQIGFTIVLGK